MKKRTFLLAMLLALLLPVLAQAAEYAVVATGKLYLRTYASSSSASKGRYSRGSWVRLDGGRTNGWYHVTTMDGRRGYMLGTYLSFSNGGSGEYAVVSTRNGGKVNVRSGPSFSYGSLGSLASGTRVTVLLRGTGWYWISGSGVTGFMSSGYLRDSYYPSWTPTPAPYTPTGTTVAYVSNPVSTQVLNLRESPYQTARSLGQYRNGKRVDVVNWGTTWTEVYVDGIHGYMMTRYLSFDGSYSGSSYYSSDTGRGSPVYDSGTNPPGSNDGIGSGVYVTPVPTASPVPTATPAVTAAASGPAAGTEIVLTPAANSGNAINVYKDANRTTVKATYTIGKTAKMLQYGQYVCMILVDGGVGYVDTANVSY